MGSDFTNISGESDQIAMLNNSAVDFYNASGTDIGAFSPVALTGAYGEASWQLSRYCGMAVFTGIPAVDDSLPWGMTLGEVRAGEFGRAVISGTAPAYFSGSGKYAVPSAAGLAAGEKGNAMILLTPLEINGGRTLPGIILLGGASAVTLPEEEYHGIFKLQALSMDTLQIVNGMNPASEFCGATDVPGTGNIPVTVMTLDAVRQWQIFLAFFYDTAAEEYSARFVTEVPENSVFSQLIGTFRSGSAEQIYQTGERRMIFGEEWYLS